MSSLTFDKYLKGTGNELAVHAAAHVALHCDNICNPLVIYGAPGVGKTHLLHSIGNVLRSEKEHLTVDYITSTEFLKERRAAEFLGLAEEFENYFLSLDVLLFDDLDLFLKSVRSTSNHEQEQELLLRILVEMQRSGRIVVAACKQNPRKIKGFKKRLRSHFGQGLSILVEPPDIDALNAILIAKAANYGFDLPDHVASFIAERIGFNMLALDRALKTVFVESEITGKNIDVPLVRALLQSEHSLNSITEREIESLKIPPHSIDAEYAVLGGIIEHGNGCWELVCDLISAEYFYLEEHCWICSAIISLAKSGRNIDIVTVADALRSMQQLELIGGLAYLGELTAASPLASNIRTYAKIVREHAISRELIKAANTIADAPGSSIPSEGVDKAYRALVLVLWV
jgi:hypothetical protein